MIYNKIIKEVRDTGNDIGKMKTMIIVTVFAVVMTCTSDPINWEMWLKGVLCGICIASWLVYFKLRGILNGRD